MENTIRIKANLKEESSNLVVNLPQTFEYLEVLSLKLNSDEVYKLHNAEYGVLVGRVTTNGGFGIPNARVSVFIPITEDDSNNAFIKSYYNYKTPYDKSREGVRYNLLTKEKQFACHVPVGTFPEKVEVLDNDVWIEIYDKYYRYNAITNESGDYMIVGVPVGAQQIHMDVDLSDIGFVSVKPYDLIAQGASPKSFDSNNRFKFSKDLDVLPHIQSANQSTNIIPFWGDRSTTEVGITQLNFNLPLNLTPHAIFFGSAFTDAEGKRVTRRCRPTEKSGNNCDLKTTNGEIEMVRKLSDYVDGIEYFPIDGKIDGDGNFTLLLPMNLQRMVTDETGVLVLSQNPNEGIPTQSKVRFRFNFSNFNYKFFGGTSRAGSYLVPNMYNRFQFGADTHEDDLFEIKWKKIYTVSQYIPKYSKNNGASALFFTGIKNIEDCDNNYSFPFNRVFTYLDPLYVFIATILGIFYVIVKAINAIPGVEIKLSCDDEELELDEWYDCIRQNLAESLGVIRYQFFNDWVNGSLYAPMFAYKVKMKNGQKKWEKYCDFDCREKVNTPPNAVNYKNKCRNAFITENNEFIDVNNPVKEINRGFVLNYDEHYYYAARSDVEKNPTVSNDLFPSEKKHLLFATNLMELGSSVKCDVDSIPYLIKLLVPTSYNENEEGDILVNIEGLKPNKFNRNGIMLISQVETEQYSDFYGYKLTGNFQNLPEYDPNTEGKTDPVAFSRNNIVLREYLCRNWKYFNNNFIYNSYINNDSNSAYFREYDDETDQLEEVVDFVYDECLHCTDQEAYKRIHPFYFYFGLKKGQNSFDLLIKNYFSDCE
jgi:hypothetical protein